MDEPTSSLTLHEVDDLFRLVRRLRNEGTAVIFISHRLEELFALADRVTVLRDGSYVDTRFLKDVTRDDLIRMMVGRTITNLFPKQEVSAGDIALKVENLTRTGSFYDVSFDLRRGEILGLAGLVGAGRTNVARAIFGVEPPTAGRMEIDGREVVITSPQQAIALNPLTMLPFKWKCGPTTSGNSRVNSQAVISKKWCWQNGFPRTRAFSSWMNPPAASMWAQRQRSTA
jgi:ABC-type sugar transport system ATPase subunit